MPPGRSTSVPRASASSGDQPQPIQVLLVRRMQAKAVRHRDGLLVPSFQFGVRNVLDFRRPVQQRSIEQFPAQGLSERTGQLRASVEATTAACPIRTGPRADARRCLEHLDFHSRPKGLRLQGIAGCFALNASANSRRGAARLS